MNHGTLDPFIRESFPVYSFDLNCYCPNSGTFICAVMYIYKYYYFLIKHKKSSGYPIKFQYGIKVKPVVGEPGQPTPHRDRKEKEDMDINGQGSSEQREQGSQK